MEFDAYVAYSRKLARRARLSVRHIDLHDDRTSRISPMLTEEIRRLPTAIPIVNVLESTATPL